MAPDQRKSIETAAEEIKKEGYFTGLLPAGDYKLEDRKFTVIAGTGKRPLDIRWGK